MARGPANSILKRIAELGVVAWLVAFASVARSDDIPKREPGELPDKLPFTRFTTKDARNREVTFYLSKTDGDRKLPILLYCPGSGCQSVFSKHENRVSSGVPGFVLHYVKGRGHVLVAEKPGVKFLDAGVRPGSSEGGSAEYLRDCTPDSWADAFLAALRSAWRLPNVDRSRTMVLGMSEGGHIAAHMAASEPAISHVADLSCGGTSQIFDFLISASRPQPGDRPGDAAKRRQVIATKWAEIQKDPDSTSKFWMGHPYRRWSTFMKTNVTEDLLRTKARVYLAHGAEDRSVPVESHDACYAELLAKGRDVTAERLDGLDHSFMPLNPEPKRGSVELAGILKRISQWFEEGGTSKEK